MTSRMTEARHPRVAALEARFAEIDVQSMRGLPLRNAALTVEAVGFAPCAADALLGVLVTPWFMNLVLLPLAPERIDPARYGRAETIPLPGGARAFLYGGDPAVGAFRAASLHSPMEVFLSPAQARAEARLRLAEALTPPAPPPPPALDRRALFGRARMSQARV
jgi:[NiFe] hydrogenase assembly HybE family chaperone